MTMVVCTVCLHRRTSVGLGCSAIDHLTLSNVSEVGENPITLFNGDRTISGDPATVVADDFYLSRRRCVRTPRPDRAT